MKGSESRKRRTSHSALVPSALPKQSAATKVSRGPQDGVFWHKWGHIHQKTDTLKRTGWHRTFNMFTHGHKSILVWTTHTQTGNYDEELTTEAPRQQSQAFVLHGDVIELLIILLSPFFFNLLLYAPFILKITFLFITTSRGLVSSTAVSLSRKESVWILFNECMRAESERWTPVLWRDERWKIKHDIWRRILAGPNQGCPATYSHHKTLFTLSCGWLQNWHNNSL